jgi:hypothetical protein
LTTSLPAGGTYNNNINGALKNLTAGYTVNMNMVNIAAQIGIITLPLIMVMYIRRMAS